ncbi:hypothetical protein E2562_026359 [Oryza meyeriana var. granulata]|uniref:Uncharacterized protein n=1 Tax=Oryza meyeriana var. granulata TaxID=110450 RepID=A0A6G1EZ55_9ORYZ|nr:hypothetical protein E2562_026359 [Oryza meyeriana var. granulata]
MVNTVTQAEPGSQVATRGEHPMWAEVNGGTHTVMIDPSHPEHFKIGDGLQPEAKDGIVELTKYLAAFRKAKSHFKGILVSSIPCSEIADADGLAKAAANNKPLPASVLYELLRRSAAQDDTDPNATSAPVTAITTTPDWRGLIIDILAGYSEGASGMEAHWLYQRARGYVLVEGAL